MGHLREVGDNRWEVFFDLPTDPVSGKRRQRSRTINGSRARAQVELEDIESKISNGGFVDDERMSLNDFTELWIEASATRVRQRTIEGYASKLRGITRHLGDRRLRALTGPVLSATYKRLLDSGLSTSSVAQAHRIVHKMLQDAVRWGYLAANPSDSADPPRVRRSDIKFWEVGEVVIFLEAVRSDRLFPFWLLAATTGMRRSELVGLRWSDVNVAEGYLRVSQTLTRVAGVDLVDDPKSAQSRREVTLDGATVVALQEWAASQADESLSEDWEESEFVFTRTVGGPLRPDSISKKFTSIVDALPVSRITFHGLRHTHATLQLASGTDVAVVSERLGHHSASFTIDRYMGRVNELHRKAADTLGGLLTEFLTDDLSEPS